MKFGELDLETARREVRRLRKMLRAIVAGGHYNLGCTCEACQATREVLAWDRKGSKSTAQQLYEGAWPERATVTPWSSLGPEIQSWWEKQAATPPSKRDPSIRRSR